MTAVDLVRRTRLEVEKALSAAGDRPGAPPARVRDAHGQYWEVAKDGTWTPMRRASTQSPGDPLDVPVVLLPPGPPAAPGHEKPGKLEGMAGVDWFRHTLEGLRAAWEAGDLSAFQVESLARVRVLVDTGGRVWTVGLRSGQWFTFAGREWHAQPGGPEPQDVVRFARGRRGCHACGAPATEDAPCGACGAPASPLFTDQPPAMEGLAQFLEGAPDAMLPERVAEPWKPPHPQTS